MQLVDNMIFELKTLSHPLEGANQELAYLSKIILLFQEVYGVGGKLNNCGRNFTLLVGLVLEH